MTTVTRAPPKAMEAVTARRSTLTAAISRMLNSRKANNSSSIAVETAKAVAGAGVAAASVRVAMRAEKVMSAAPKAVNSAKCVASDRKAITNVNRAANAQTVSVSRGVIVLKAIKTESRVANGPSAVMVSSANAANASRVNRTAIATTRARKAFRTVRNPRFCATN